MFVCSYTDPDVLAHTPKGELGKGINVYRLDGKTGKLVSEETLSLRPNPAFLVAHPTRPLLYGTTECITRGGELFALTLGDRSAATAAAAAAADGDGGDDGASPADLENGALRASAASAAAADGAHAGFAEVASVALEKGLGPRHLVFHPRLPLAFVINELRSTVATLAYTDPASLGASAAAPLRCSVGADAAERTVLRQTALRSTLPAAYASTPEGRGTVFPDGT